MSASDSQKPTNEAQGEATLRISDLLAAVVVKAKSEGRKYLCCGDFYHLEEWPGCCVSCHEDNEEYGYDLCSAEINGMDVECCCKVSTWIGEVQKAANAEVSEGGTRDARIETAAQSRPSLH